MEDAIAALRGNIAELNKYISDDQRAIERMDRDQRELVAEIEARLVKIKSAHNQIMRLEEGIRALEAVV